MPEFGGQRVPQRAQHRGRGVLGLRQPRLQALPHADARRRARAGAVRLARQQKQTFLPKMVQRRMDRHHGAHRAAGRLGPRRRCARARCRRAITTGCSARRSSSPGAITTSRANTIHMVLGRIDGAPAGVKGISLFIVPKFLVNADGSLGRAQRGALPVRSSTSSASTRAPPASWPTARSRARSRYLVGEPGPRPRIHVHHDEQRAPVGGQRGLRGRRARLPARGRVGAHARAGQAAGGRGRGPRADHQSPGREAHAADDEGADARPRARSFSIRHSSSTSPSTAREAARARGAGARRAADAHRQGLVHRARQRDRRHRRAGARRHGLHRGDRRGAVRARRAHHHHLRRHDRHPVERPHRPQARPRRRRGHGGAAHGHGARAAGRCRERMPASRASARRPSTGCGCCAMPRPRCSLPSARAPTPAWQSRCRT